MRCACIDVGSNTTRLLVAEADPAGGLRAVAAARAFTRLCAGREATGDLAADRIAASADAVRSQVDAARAAGAERVRVVATAAVRDAARPAAVLAALEAAAGIPVELLDPGTEAAYAFTGATRTLAALPDGLLAVVDVGGGSTELVTGTPGDGIGWTASVAVGSAVLAERHLRSDPPTAAELEAVCAAADAALAGVAVPARPAAAFAVGGSATALWQLAGPRLDPEPLRDLVRRLFAGVPSERIAGEHGLHPQRARILPAGIALLASSAAVLGVPLRIAGGGLREGVVLELLDG